MFHQNSSAKAEARHSMQAMKAKVFHQFQTKDDDTMVFIICYLGMMEKETDDTYRGTNFASIPSG